MSGKNELTNEELELLKSMWVDEEYPSNEDVDLRKKLTVVARMKIAEAIQREYSLLRGKKDLFNAQMFSVMEDYLKKCNSTGYRLEGL